MATLRLGVRLRMGRRKRPIPSGVPHTRRALAGEVWGLADKSNPKTVFS